MADILSRAISALRQCSPAQKAAQTLALVQDWNDGDISFAPPGAHPAPPDNPGRPEQLDMVAPGAVPRRRIGTPEGRIALLHAIAHIELNAIDLALDMVARFTYDVALANEDRHSFANDWLNVAGDEAKHFTLITKRLDELNSHYGAMPVHQGLWEAALNTKNDLAARLAIAPMLLEARGLDVTPKMIERLNSAGDTHSASILGIIYDEEIGHVAKGVHWFNRICAAKNAEPQQYFQSLVREYLPAGLRPPFNHNAREMAGLSAGYYENFLP